MSFPLIRNIRGNIWPIWFSICPFTSALSPARQQFSSVRLIRGQYCDWPGVTVGPEERRGEEILNNWSRVKYARSPWVGPGSSWGWKLPAGEEVMILIRQIIMLISQMCSLTLLSSSYLYWLKHVYGQLWLRLLDLSWFSFYTKTIRVEYNWTMSQLYMILIYQSNSDTINQFRQHFYNYL